MRLRCFGFLLVTVALGAAVWLTATVDLANVKGDLFNMLGRRGDASLSAAGARAH